MAQIWDFDVAVVGGGPGGSTAASALARSGRRVVVLERDRFPRFHIGESQLPWINEILDKIGAKSTVAGAGFVEKWGASFTSADGSRSQYADFARAFEVPVPQTFQVPRDRFDRVLLEHAAACGAQVRQGCAASRADFEPDGVTVTYASDGAGESSIRVGAVIDASGRTGFLAKHVGERRRDPLLQNVAVHRQYEGIPRSDGRRAGDIRMVTRPDLGWFWFIPISAATTSVGIVLPLSAYKTSARQSAEETLASYLAETPAAADLVRDARPVSAARFEADYSYLHSRHAGDRFLLVGDAGAFLDPIFSTGVFLAMQSGLEAAELLHDGLQAGDLGASRFVEYEQRLIRRYHHFRRFAAGFYDPVFRDLFFSSSARFGLYESVLSVMGGNWRPSWTTRLRLEAFFAVVALHRRFPGLRSRHN